MTEIEACCFVVLPDGVQPAGAAGRVVNGARCVVVVVGGDVAFLCDPDAADRLAAGLRQAAAEARTSERLGES